MPHFSSKKVCRALKPAFFDSADVWGVGVSVTIKIKEGALGELST